MFKDLIHGANYVRKGFILLKNPELLMFLIIPSAAGLIALGFLAWTSITYLSHAWEWITNLFPEWLFTIILWTIKLLPQWILYTLKFLVWLSCAFLFGLTFTTLTLFFSSPFNGLLAEKTERLLNKREDVSKESYLTIFTSIPGSITRELSKLMHYFKLVLAVIFISFIPFLNSLAPILWLLIGAWMMYIHFLDYPMDNHNYNIRCVRQLGRANLTLSLGFGGMVSILATIPIINILVIPSAVIGATIFWCENSKDLLD